MLSSLSLLESWRSLHSGHSKCMRCAGERKGTKTELIAVPWRSHLAAAAGSVFQLVLIKVLTLLWTSIMPLQPHHYHPVHDGVFLSALSLFGFILTVSWTPFSWPTWPIPWLLTHCQIYDTCKLRSDSWLIFKTFHADKMPCAWPNDFTIVLPGIIHTVVSSNG